MRENIKFERKIIKFCNSDKCKDFSGVNFSPKPKEVGFEGIKHSFDLVSDNGKYIGDAKYFSMRKKGKIPHAKMKDISEYVWLLEKTKAKHKFLIFGRDKEVPEYWLKRFGGLTKVKFYFFSGRKTGKAELKVMRRD